MPVLATNCCEMPSIRLLGGFTQLAADPRTSQRPREHDFFVTQGSSPATPVMPARALEVEERVRRLCNHGDLHDQGDRELDSRNARRSAARLAAPRRRTALADLPPTFGPSLFFVRAAEVAAGLHDSHTQVLPPREISERFSLPWFAPQLLRRDVLLHDAALWPAGDDLDGRIHPRER